MTRTNNESSAEQNAIEDFQTPDSVPVSNPEPTNDIASAPQNNGGGQFNSKRTMLKRKFTKKSNSESEAGSKSISEPDDFAQANPRENNSNQEEQKNRNDKNTKELGNHNSQNNHNNGHYNRSKKIDKKNKRHQDRNENKSIYQEDRKYDDKSDNSDLGNNQNDSQAEQNIKKETYYVYNLRRTGAEQLMQLAATLNINSPENLHKNDLVFEILQRLTAQGHIIVGRGVLEVLQDGYGFLRSAEANYTAGPDDVYIAPHQIRQNGLRTGDTIEGILRPPKKGERYFALHSINTVNDLDPQKNKIRTHFDDLTPIFPNKQICLEGGSSKSNISSRIIDITAPLGRGQRALVVAPPRTGKTILMQNIADSIATNYPDISIIVLLIGERPEEVTDMIRSVKGEVVSSTFDEPSQRHVQLAEMVIEKAKRMVETKRDVVILLDSITRLARAYNDIAPSSGKVLSGGVDSNALQRPKRVFGAARNIEEGGSLTIIATALIESGSRMDEVIFEEFKGTGNSEIVLDRRIADKRTFPAIDITKSGTRKEDLLIDKSTLSKIWILRRITNPIGATEAVEFFIDKLKHTKTNAEFFAQMDTYNSTVSNIKKSSSNF